MNVALRKAVSARAGGACEACSGPLDNASVDHAFGKKNAPEEMGTLWLLCFKCHRAKTDNHPDARTWVGRFMTFAAIHGYADSARRCQMRLEWIEAKGPLTGR